MKSLTQGSSNLQADRWIRTADWYHMWLTDCLDSFFLNTLQKFYKCLCIHS